MAWRLSAKDRATDSFYCQVCTMSYVNTDVQCYGPWKIGFAIRRECDNPSEKKVVLIVACCFCAQATLKNMEEIGARKSETEES